jgi:hypothetical protein
MCTLVVVRTSRVPFLLGANRDEMLDRPWSPPSRVRRAVQPRDDRAGGTWIGRGAFVAAVTNRLHVPTEPGRRSRGELCAAVLQLGSIAEARALVRQAVVREPYNGFNLLVGDGREAWLLTWGDGSLVERELPLGVSTITSRHDLNHTGLLDVRERVLASLDELPIVLRDHGPHGDDGYVICKHGDVYGTRSASLVGPESFRFAPGRPCEHDFVEVAA